MWRLAVLGLVVVAALAWAVAVSLGSSARRPRPAPFARVKHRAAPPPKDVDRNWPNAADTGAQPRLVTKSLPVTGGFFTSNRPNLTIKNTEIDGGVYWTGPGTLTLRNDIIKPDWTQAWAAVAAAGSGNVRIDHVTIAGVNVGAPGKFTKGIMMQSTGSLSVAHLNESGICQNTIGSGPTVIQDSYLHDLGSANAATCHATGVEIEGPTQGPVSIVHNTIDEFPGRQFQAGSDGAIFVQALYGAISGIAIDNNFLHSAYFNIEIAGDGGYGVVGPTVADNCLAWPRGGKPLSAPGIGVSSWTGNTKCNLAGQDTGRIVRVRVR